MCVPRKWHPANWRLGYQHLPKCRVRHIYVSRYPKQHCFSFPWHNSPSVGQGFLHIEASRSHSDTPHSVGLHRKTDRPVSPKSTWLHRTLIRDRHQCSRRYSNTQSRHFRGRRPTPQTARSLGPDSSIGTASIVIVYKFTVIRFQVIAYVFITYSTFGNSHY